MKLISSKSLVIMVVGAALVLVTMPATAQQSPQELQQQIQQLQQQNQMLQQQLQQLQSAVSALKDSQEKQKTTMITRLDQIPEEMAKYAPVKPKGKEKIYIKGFISSTFFSQDANFAFGNGQNAEWPKEEYDKNEWFTGGDVRNTRLDIGFTGPKLAKWTAGGLVEMDFFGGYNGAGAFSQQQPHLRMRLAYVEIKKGQTKWRFGQDWSPLFGEWPISGSHIAFPLGYGSAGYVGWRFPGVYFWQGLSDKDAPVKLQFQGGIFEGSWNGPGPPTALLSAGNVGFLPQLEARLNIVGKGWKVYVVGHYDKKDLKGVGEIVPDPPIKDSITGTAFEVGAKFTPGNWLLHGNIYTGKGIGQQFGAITQFGDISSWGGWFQVGYNFTKNWSLYGFYGMENPDNKDVLEWGGSRMENTMFNLHLRYAFGPYWFSIEYLHDEVKVGADENKVKGNQIALSWLYKF